MNKLIKPKAEGATTSRFKNEVAAKPVKKRDEGFKAGRLSMEAYNAIRDIYYEQKLGSFAEAADIVVNFYLENNKKR